MRAELLLNWATGRGGRRWTLR